MSMTCVNLEAFDGTRHIGYLPAQTRKTVGVLFLTEAARKVATTLLMQQSGLHALVVAPWDLANDEWVRQATRYCRGWTIRYMHDGKLETPIEILAAIDTLHMIASEPTPESGFDLKLSEPAEDLLWLAFDLGIEAKYYNTERTQLIAPKTCLQKRAVPKRVAAQRAQRTAFTRQLKEIRLATDYCSSGLWDEEGRMLGYDLLDLPFSLVRRIAAWQRDYDETANPSDMFSEAWREHHWQETIEIAKSLQTALGKNTIVKLHRPQGWMGVDEIVRFL